jgi:hypothetical protein
VQANSTAAGSGAAAAKVQRSSFCRSSLLLLLLLLLRLRLLRLLRLRLLRLLLLLLLLRLLRLLLLLRLLRFCGRGAAELEGASPTTWSAGRRRPWRPATNTHAAERRGKEGGQVAGQEPWSPTRQDWRRARAAAGSAALQAAARKHAGQ